MHTAIKEKVFLNQYATLQVGGPAAYFADVHTEQDLDGLLGYAASEALPVTVLGGGSNALISDDGLQGLVLRMCIADEPEMQVLDNGNTEVTAGAGMVLDDLVAWTVEKGLWGLENLSHIPGSVGATPIQNVGAYGVEVKDCISKVRVYNMLDRSFQVMTNQECQFAYRDSIFKHAAGKHLIVTAVSYELFAVASPVLGYRDLHEKFADTQPSQNEIREAVIAIRDKKFPDWHTVGTAGSFFKNPIVAKDKLAALLAEYPQMPHFEVDASRAKIPLGWVLDKVLDLKGGGTEKVGQYEGQALVLINKGGATAADIQAHAQSVVDAVKEKIDVDVEWEVTRLGF